MRETILAGVLALLMSGGPAVAQVLPEPEVDIGFGEEGMLEEPGVLGEEPGVLGEEEPGLDEEPGLGGAGDVGFEDEPGVLEDEGMLDEDPGLGGAGDVGLDEQPGVLQDPGVLDEPGLLEEPGFGGAGDIGADEELGEPGVLEEEPGVLEEDPGLGGAGDFGLDEEEGVLEEPGVMEGEELIIDEPQDFGFEPLEEDEVGLGEGGLEEDSPFFEEEGAFGGAGLEVTPVRELADMRGLTVMLGAGLEGYTGNLAPNVDPGAALAVTATMRPSRLLGLEVGYSGAINDLDPNLDVLDEGGADLVRNGGHAALLVGLTATPMQPYLLGGVGVSYYNVRNGENLGFQDDTVGTVPLGVGVRSHIGNFTADTRLHYNFLLGQQFAPTEGDTSGSYAATINFGGTF